MKNTIPNEIDTVLAEYHGFTAEELDFIPHYGIKYRFRSDTETGRE